MTQSDSGNDAADGRAAAMDGWFEGRVHVRPVRVYYEDTDFSGVVYHADYLRFFERGRSDFLRMAGVHHAELAARPAPLHFAVIHMDIAFKAPARIDDLLHVRTAYEEMRGARFVIAQEIARGSETLSTARVTAACMNAAGRPARLPGDILETLKPYLAAR